MPAALIGVLSYGRRSSVDEDAGDEDRVCWRWIRCRDPGSGAVDEWT